MAGASPSDNGGRLARLTRAYARSLEPTGTAPVVWRSLAFLYIGAGGMSVATVALGVDSEASKPAILVFGLVSLLSGVALIPISGRVPKRLVGPALLCGLAMVTAVVVASNEADSPYLLFYVWIGAEAWFFLRARTAIAITLLTVVVSAVVVALLAGDDPDAASWWVMTVGTLLAVAALAGVLHGRARRLIVQLADVAVRDELTGLLNRRGYQQRLDEELARARRYDTPLSIVLGDLDAFKALNDQFGHRHGDEALQRFAAVCLEHLREADFVSRVGGEEFAIVLPNTAESGGIYAAERIRRAVSEGLRTPEGTPVTASFGVATFPRHGDTPETLLDHADQAMYAAKALGRNRTIAFGDDLPRADRPTGEQEHRQAVVLLAETLDLRDAGTRAHSETVAKLSQRIATALGLAPERVERIRLAGLLHDIGKIGVPDGILRKAGPLDAGEWAEMRKHPEFGARIVDGAGLRDIAQWVLAHHERPDGRGYPLGIAGSEIPLEARILAVADAYEAMTADRPYRQSIGAEAAAAEMRAGAGTQFDADVVRAFLAVEDPRAQLGAVVA